MSWEREVGTTVLQSGEAAAVCEKPKSSPSFNELLEELDSVGCVFVLLH